MALLLLSRATPLFLELKLVLTFGLNGVMLASSRAARPTSAAPLALCAALGS